MNSWEKQTTRGGSAAQAERAAQGGRDKIGGSRRRSPSAKKAVGG